MSDLISRQAAIVALDDRMSSLENVNMQIAMGFAKGIIHELPSVTPAPKIGHWIKCIDDNGSSYYLCSVCRCGEDFKFDFCPNCGSDNKEMEE